MIALGQKHTSPRVQTRRGQPLLQRGGVALLLHTGVRGTMVGVQVRVRLGAQKVNERNGKYRAAGERGGRGGGDEVTGWQHGVDR